MRVGPFFKWFGSKWSATKRGCYPSLEEEIKIFEPFAGSAGYSCNFSDLEVCLYDSNPQLQELWGWLIKEAKASDIKEIPINLPEKTDIQSLGLSRGQSLLLKHWQRTNTIGKSWLTSPWGNLPGQWTANTRARISEEIYAIKHWEFDQSYSMDSLAEQALPGTYFIDPCYMYNFQYSLPPTNYKMLARQVNMLKEGVEKDGGLIIVCEAIGKNGEVPRWLPFEEAYSSATSRRKSLRSRELIFEFNGA